jgi:hypothetical protein
VVFLGILINALAFELRLPPEKVQRIQVLISSWCTKKSCTRKELESFLGHLCHAATVVRPGRTFLRELFRLLHQAKLPYHHVRLSAGAKADILWWRHFLQSWSGLAFFPQPQASTHVYSDASGSWGCGAIAEGLGWLQLPWPAGYELDISAKELVPVVLAAALWGPQWARQHICFHSDNMAVVSVLKSRAAKSLPIAHLLRCLAFYSAFYGFHFSAEHVPGVLNIAADAISRNATSVFLPFTSQIPQFHISMSLHQLLVLVRPDWGSPTWTKLFVSSLTRVLPGTR